MKLASIRCRNDFQLSSIQNMYVLQFEYIYIIFVKKLHFHNLTKMGNYLKMKYHTCSFSLIFGVLNIDSFTVCAFIHSSEA